MPAAFGEVERIGKQVLIAVQRGDRRAVARLMYRHAEALERATGEPVPGKSIERCRDVADLLCGGR